MNADPQENSLTSIASKIVGSKIKGLHFKGVSTLSICANNADWIKAPKSSHFDVWIDYNDPARRKVEFAPLISRWTAGTAPYLEKNLTAASDGKFVFALKTASGPINQATSQVSGEIYNYAQFDLIIDNISSGIGFIGAFYRLHGGDLLRAMAQNSSAYDEKIVSENEEIVTLELTRTSISLNSLLNSRGVQNDPELKSQIERISRLSRNQNVSHKEFVSYFLKFDKTKEMALVGSQYDVLNLNSEKTGAGTDLIVSDFKKIDGFWMPWHMVYLCRGLKESTKIEVQISDAEVFQEPFPDNTFGVSFPIGTKVRDHR